MGLGISTASYGFYSKNNPSGFITNKDVVFTTGDQTISGDKTFTNNLLFNNDENIYGGTRISGNQSDINIRTFQSYTDLTFKSDFIGGYIQDIISFRNSNNTGMFGPSINYDVPTSFNYDSIIFYQTGQGYANIFSKGPYLRLGYHNIISEVPDSRLGIGTLFPQEKVHISGGNLRVDGNIGVSGFYNFNINTTGQPSEGQMTWSPDYNTVQIGMDAGNVINPVGFKSFYRVKAQSTIRKGTVVMAAGAVGGSEYILAREAQNIGPSGELIMGVSAEEILANNFGDVVAFGPIKGVNTSTFISGNVLYYDPLSTGGFTNTLPQAPNAKVLVGLTLTQNNNGVVFVRVGAGSELGKTDSNVIFSTLQNNDIIKYNLSSGIWVNGLITTGDISGISNYATTENLASTGSTLNTRIDNLSGYSNNTFSTITNLALTGSTLNTRINSLSGTLTGEYLKTSNTHLWSKNMYDSQVGGASAGYAGRSPDGSLTLYAASQNTAVPSFYGWDGFQNSSFTAATARTNLGITSTALQSENSFVRTTGDQTISGSKTFSVRPFVNTTGVLLSGEAATSANLASTGSILNTKIDSLSGYLQTQINNISGLSGISGFTGDYYLNSNPSGFITGIPNIVFTTGDQTINGVKTFDVVRFEEYNGNGINLIPSDYQASSETLTIADDTQDVIAAFDADTISLNKPTYHNHRPTVSINNGPFTGVLLSGETFPENNNTKYNYFTTNITLSTNYINLANSTSGITATLPSIASGRNYIVKNLNTGTLTVTGSNFIDGNVNLKLYKNESAHLLGVNNVGFTGWVTLNTNPGAS